MKITVMLIPTIETTLSIETKNTTFFLLLEMQSYLVRLNYTTNHWIRSVSVSIHVRMELLHLYDHKSEAEWKLMQKIQHKQPIITSFSNLIRKLKCIIYKKPRYWNSIFSATEQTNKLAEQPNQQGEDRNRTLARKAALSSDWEQVGSTPSTV